MNIVETSTGKFLPAVILPVEPADYKSLGRKRYYFDWNSERNQEVYKLCKTGSAKYGVDSRYDSEKERKSEAVALMEARIRKMRGLTGKNLTTPSQPRISGGHKLKSMSELVSL